METGNSKISEEVYVDMRKQIILFLATGLGCGYSPIFPGAIGAFLGFLLSLLLFQLPNYLRLILGFCFIGVSFFVTEKAQHYFSKIDPHEIIIDEIAGVVCASLFFQVPGWFVVFGIKIPFYLLWAFLLFGLLDKFKPFPASRFHQSPTKFGIVFDDIVSGIYAGLVVLFVVLWIDKI